MSASCEVQTPAQAAVAAEREATQSAELSSPALGLRLVPTLDDLPDEKDTNMDAGAPRAGDLPLMRLLLAAYMAGEIEPEPVALGPLPVWASPQMAAIADDIRTRLGLLRAEGVYQAMPYAISEAVRPGLARASSSASVALRRLCEEGVIRHVGNLPPLGKRDGTKLYVPPGWVPTDPAARAVVAETGRHERAADLVWVPVETLGLDAASS
jgi:hypothetical protein